MGEVNSSGGSGGRSGRDTGGGDTVGVYTSSSDRFLCLSLTFNY